MAFLRHQRSVRLIAGLLAVTALAARPLEATLACPMLPLTGESESIPVADVHAHHLPDAVSADVAGHPDDERPVHESCPDLAHCAVAVPALAPILSDAAELPLSLRVDVLNHLLTRLPAALDPPPPK